MLHQSHRLKLSRLLLEFWLSESEVSFLVSDEEREDEASAYGIELESSAEMTLEGKYRCRECGQVFNTLEEHDDHHRKVHGSPETYPSQGMAM